MTKHKLTLFTFFFSLIAISCNRTNDRTNENVVTFTNDILPIITENCTNRGCHHGGEQFSLLTYEDVIKNGYIVEGNPKDNMLYQFITSKNLDERMPPQPYPSLTAEQLKLIYTWIKQGAPK